MLVLSKMIQREKVKLANRPPSLFSFRCLPTLLYNVIIIIIRESGVGGQRETEKKRGEYTEREGRRERRQADRQTETETQRETETDRERQRQTERDRDRQTDRERQRKRDRDTETERDRDRNRERQRQKLYGRQANRLNKLSFPITPKVGIINLSYNSLGWQSPD